MARERAHREPVEVARAGARARRVPVSGQRPAELVHQRAEHERAVHTAAGDDHVGARVERARDRTRTAAPAHVHVHSVTNQQITDAVRHPLRLDLNPFEEQGVGAEHRSNDECIESNRIESDR